MGASPNLLGEGALRIVKTCWVLEILGFWACCDEGIHISGVPSY